MTDTNGRRIHELAKELGISSKELREQIVSLGFDWDVSNHMKKLTGEQVAAYHAKVAGDEAPTLRIHQLAKEMGISSKELREKIVALGFDWDVSNHMKSLTGAQQAELAAAMDKAPKKAAPKKKAAAKGKKDAPKKDGKKAKAKKDAPKKGDAPTGKKAKKDEKKAEGEKPKRAKSDDDKGRERRDRRPRREDVPDPEGFDPVGSGVPYVKAVLKQLGLPRARVTGTYDGRRLEINIKGGGAVALVGSANAGASGRVLDSLQLLTSKVAFGDLSRARKISIDVDGFRAGRVDALRDAGKRIARFVADKGVHVRLPAMNNFDRYAFHKSAGRARGVEVGSEGMGAFRMLGISPRNKRRDDAPAANDAPRAEATTDEAAPTEGGETKRRRRRRSSKSAE